MICSRAHVVADALSRYVSYDTVIGAQSAVSVCVLCTEAIMFATFPTEISVHSECWRQMPPTCGLPMEMYQGYMTMQKYIRQQRSEATSRSSQAWEKDNVSDCFEANLVRI